MPSVSTAGSRTGPTARSAASPRARANGSSAPRAPEQRSGCGRRRSRQRAWMPPPGRSDGLPSAAAGTGRLIRWSERTGRRDRWAIPLTGSERHPRGRWSRTLPPRSCLSSIEPSSTVVGELEAAGHRQLANRVRADAIRIYSRAWDDRARRELIALLRRNVADPVDAADAARAQPVAGRSTRPDRPVDPSRRPSPG